MVDSMNIEPSEMAYNIFLLEGAMLVSDIAHFTVSRNGPKGLSQDHLTIEKW